jgi:predicted transglutaminase-like protease
MVAIQDGVIPTRNYQKYIMKTMNIKDECKKCGEKGETIKHVISRCRKMANEEYIKRHNNVAKIILQELASEYQLIKEKVPTFKYEADVVLENT